MRTSSRRRILISLGQYNWLLFPHFEILGFDGSQTPAIKWTSTGTNSEPKRAAAGGFQLPPETILGIVPQVTESESESVSDRRPFYIYGGSRSSLVDGLPSNALTASTFPLVSIANKQTIYVLKWYLTLNSSAIVILSVKWIT